MNKCLPIFVALVATFALAGAVSAAPASSVVYSSLLSSPLHGNMPSLGGEAYAFSELGNDVTFSTTSRNRSLSSVVVTMSSWACQSGHWTTGDCLTTKGATFPQPITFNIYRADGTTLIASAAQTFAIPYRPSASTKCGDGRWYDTALKQCFNGLATNITFSAFTYVGGAAIALPDSIVFGISYNTSGYGTSPLGYANPCNTTPAGCAYDSLNIALSTESDVSAGSDTTPGSIQVDGVSSSAYAPYVPAVQIKAAR
jgi:hypothetical protein